jgi:PAS domain S-box-containing protein
VNRPLRALIVDDSEDDALLILRELHRSGYKVTHRQVQTAEGMAEALAREPWDVVLSDYSMPRFSAPAALEVLKASGIDLPFIIVSGTIGEETAVAALKAGAHDFLLKSQLARFVPALDRELREAEGRRERRRAVEALRENELKYRRIVETANEGIWMIDAQSRTTYANRRMAEMLGATPEALIGKSLFDFTREEWKETVRANLDPKHPAGTDQPDILFCRVDGSGFWGRLSTNHIRDDDGNDIGALAMVTDVTEQKKLQEQLMVSDRMASIGTLAAGVAHEINNPLAAVLANLQLGVRDLDEALEHSPDNSQLRNVHEGLLDALDAAERVRSIVRDLKVLSRSQDEKSSPVDVEHVVESSLRMVGIEIRHRARLVKDFRPLPLVMANESRLGQVCLNLLVNAAQAIDEGHIESNEIRVSTYTDSHGRVVIEIRDTGGGMPAEVLRRLFTPFFTTKPIGVGTGLGLSICHRIISSLGGEITVESIVGKGTTFRVFLPPAPDGTKAGPPVEVQATEPPARRGRILVVDDEPSILSTLRRILADAHDVTSTTSALDAIRRIASGERYDVILCDLIMPHVTGMDFYAELMQFEPEQARRVVFLTGGAFSPRARSFLDEVPNLRLEKPFNQVDLKRVVRDRLR